MAQKSKDTICKDYEEADNLAKEAWERVKKARKKKERGTFEEAINEFSKAMEQVYKAWPPVVEELEIRVDTSATKTAFLAGYAEAKGIMQKAGVWVDPSVNKGEGSPYRYAVLRGDHVASRTLYKVARIFPY